MLALAGAFVATIVSSTNVWADAVKSGENAPLEWSCDAGIALPE